MSDIVFENGIRAFLNKELNERLEIDIKESVGSTNDEVKALAVQGVGEGFLLVSRSQTNGKGRLGRSFFSPDFTGVYMSLLLRPACSAEETPLITTAAAVAVCEALENEGVKPEIKWVNDVFVDRKKVCGILTQAGFSGSSTSPDYVVLGVGVNMYTPLNGFPEELQGIAGAALPCEREGVCNRFIASFLNSFFSFYERLSSHCHVQAYRERCFVLGKQINILHNEKSTPATALDVDDNCNLVVQLTSGERAVLSSGEISVRVVSHSDQ